MGRGRRAGSEGHDPAQIGIGACAGALQVAAMTVGGDHVAVVSRRHEHGCPIRQGRERFASKPPFFGLDMDFV